MIDQVRDSMHKLKRDFFKGKKVLWVDGETEVTLKVYWKMHEFHTRSQHVQENRSEGETKCT